MSASLRSMREAASMDSGMTSCGSRKTFRLVAVTCSKASPRQRQRWGVLRLVYGTCSRSLAQAE